MAATAAIFAQDPKPVQRQDNAFDACRSGPWPRHSHAEAPVGGAQVSCLQTHIAERQKREACSMLIESVLGGLARHRTDGADLDAAFAKDELRRLKAFLAFASDAKCELVRSRTKSRRP